MKNNNLADDFSNFISDYLYNQDYNLDDINFAFEKAKLKLKNEIENLYKKVK